MQLLTSRYDQWMDTPTPKRFFCEMCSKESDQEGEDPGLCVDCDSWAKIEGKE